ncbi:hypothetical protein KJ918_04180 [Patescibacteria group bacterium]|nr:hypothetical protein [Patescibacteria group bacterium]
MGNKELENSNLKFTEGTVYKDLREAGGNAYRDIKMSLSLGTSSDLIYYLKKHSKLLCGFSGNEVVEELAKGTFSQVYIVKSGNGKEVVVKRSHDGWIPFQMGRYFFISVPRGLVKLAVHNFDITAKSLKRDVYDYEKILRPFWGDKRASIESAKFEPFLNMALHMVDQFLPEFSTKDLYSKKFWHKFFKLKRHKDLRTFKKYLKDVANPILLIPGEERYIFFDSFSQTLQTVFLQEAMRGEEDIIIGKDMAYPYELISHGVIPKEMPRIMIEHILRTFESFYEQLDCKNHPQKIPDFRPVESWKVFPPTPYEIYFAETGNLVAYKQNNGKVNVALVDTHMLHDPEEDISFRWVEKRAWISMFLNLRFWVRKALESM